MGAKRLSAPVRESCGTQEFIAEQRACLAICGFWMWPMSPVKHCLPRGHGEDNPNLLDRSEAKYNVPCKTLLALRTWWTQSPQSLDTTEGRVSVGVKILWHPRIHRWAKGLPVAVLLCGHWLYPIPVTCGHWICPILVKCKPMEYASF